MATVCPRQGHTIFPLTTYKHDGNSTVGFIDPLDKAVIPGKYAANPEPAGSGIDESTCMGRYFTLSYYSNLNSWPQLSAFINIPERKGRWPMIQIRREVQTFVSDCENLLDSYVFPELTKDEKDLVVYYVNELAQKFDSGRRGPTAV